MADDKDVSSQNSKENEEIQTEMAPPSLPKEAKKKPKTSQIEKKEDDSINKEESFPEIPYKEPSWGGLPEDANYNLELLKNGCIISTVDLTKKAYHLFGRLPNCDVVMEHPSISRYHAVIQYKASESAKSEQGFYLYDLGSTHGTMINKVPIEPKRYYRLRVGYVIKFGGSSRLYILQGPQEPDEEELAVMQEENNPQGEVGKVMTEEEIEKWKQKQKKKDEDEDNTEGIDWGMGEDAVEEDPIYPPNFGDKSEEEHAYFKDPKKTLRGYFEREGLDLEYEVEETGPGHARVYHCRVKLPIEMANGEPMYAEAMVTGKKRESVLECATEACRILDANGLLRQSSHESKKHKQKNWEDNDYYDSDEDTFLDRTGSIEKKRVKRMKISGKTEEAVETFESLSSKLKAVEDEIQSNEDKLQQAMQALQSGKDSEDSLDDYMSNVGTILEKNARMQIRRKIFDLKKEKKRLKKLVNISRPATLPGFAKSTETTPAKKAEEKPGDNRLSPIKTPSAATEYHPTAIADSEKESRQTDAESTTKEQQESEETEDTRRNTPDKETEELKPDKKGFAMPSAALLKKSKLKAVSGSISAASKIAAEESEKTEDTRPDRPGEDSENSKPANTEGFAMPSAPPLKKAKTKAASGSISAVLAGIHGRSPQNTEDKGSTRRRDRTPQKAEKETDNNDKEEDETPRKKKKKAHTYGAPTEWEAIIDPTFSSWQPPSDQTGDGRTKLNEKYGY